MRKCSFLAGLISFIVFFLISTTIQVRAASGDFYNVTKKLKYSRADLVANRALVVQLQSEYDAGDVVVKELSSGNTIDYAKANSQFLELLKTMKPQEAVIGAINSEDVKVDRTAAGLDNFSAAELEFDVASIY